MSVALLSLWEKDTELAAKGNASVFHACINNPEKE
jgi:hypothetical protein